MIARTAALIGLIAVTCACGTSEEDATVTATGEATTTTTTRSMPDFDPCTALDEDFRRAHDLDEPRPFTDTVSPYSWVGCTYATSRYGIQISVTNGTVAEAVAKNFADTVELMVNDRRAVRYDGTPDKVGDCTVYVEADGGSLDVSVRIPDLAISQGIEPCRTAVDMAIDVEPLLTN